MKRDIGLLSFSISRYEDGRYICHIAKSTKVLYTSTKFRSLEEAIEAVGIMSLFKAEELAKEIEGPTDAEKQSEATKEMLKIMEKFKNGNT